MVTMLSGAALMDGALLVLSATEPCPQAQDREHLAAAEITGIDNLIIVQNKIDVVEKSQIMQRYHEIQDFIKGTIAEPAPIIPVSAQRGVNIDQVIEMIEKIIPTPHREFQKSPLMPILRSFDVNKPGTPADEILGGVIGGSISQGIFEVDDQIEIRPGVRVERGGKVLYEPLFTDIVSLHVGKHTVKKASCGGLIGVGTLLDPAQTKADSLVGNIIGKPENLPPVLNDLTIDVKLFERAIGTEELLKVDNIRRNEALVLNVGTAVTAGVVSASKRDIVDVALRRPICAGPATQVAVSRRIGEGWRLIGFGKVV
jgi:translation initiation factor 2 subunit 3